MISVKAYPYIDGNCFSTSLYNCLLARPPILKFDLVFAAFEIVASNSNGKLIDIINVKMIVIAVLESLDQFVSI